MSEEFDPTKAVAEIVTSLAAKAADNIATKGTSFFTGISVNVRLLTSSHKKYITRVSRDFVKAKSFLNPQTKKPLSEFYVPLGISRSGNTYEDASMENLTFLENANVITGSGRQREVHVDALSLPRRFEAGPKGTDFR